MQNFKNHTRLSGGFHGVALGLALFMLVVAIINLVEKIGDGAGIMLAVFFVLIPVVLILVAFYARSFALKAQDRAIRAEENLRHFALTGKLLDPRLGITQIVALRFASDDEFVALAGKAAAEGMGNKRIKQAIGNWRADHHRV